MLRLSLVLILCVTACVTKIPPRSYPQPEPMTIADSVGAVWSAIIDVITERQLPIKTVDRASGVVQTEIAGSMSGEWWDCGRRSVTGGEEESIAEVEGVYVVLTVSAVPRGITQTQVRIAADARISQQTGAPCSSRGIYEPGFLDHVVARWKELSGREPGPEAAPITAEPVPLPPAEPTPAVPPPAPPREPSPPPQPQPAGAGYAPGLDRVFLTGCEEGRLIHDFAPLFDSPTMAREIAVVEFGGTAVDCAGPPAILQELRVTGTDVVYEVELIESSARGWVLARFVGRSVTEADCIERFEGRFYLLAKCTGQ
jgi:hypothetical protein